MKRERWSTIFKLASTTVPARRVKESTVATCWDPL